MATRSLRTVLHDGEVVRFNRADSVHEASFEDGQLVYGSTTQCFRSLSAFASFCASYSVNGWKACKVQRDGKWLSCDKLPPLTASAPVPSPKGKVQSKSMPPKKSATATAAKAPAPAPTIRRVKVPPATVPSTIVASILEPAESALEVSSVVRVMLRRHEHASKSYWRDGKKEKLFVREANGNVGPYIGRWNAAAQTIDTSVPDSDTEN